MPRPSRNPERGTMPDVLGLLSKTKFKDDDWDKPLKERDIPRTFIPAKANKPSVATDKSKLRDMLQNNDSITPDSVNAELGFQRNYLVTLISQLSLSDKVTIYKKKSRVGNIFHLEYSLKPFENPINDKN